MNMANMIKNVPIRILIQTFVLLSIAKGAIKHTDEIGLDICRARRYCVGESNDVEYIDEDMRYCCRKCSCKPSCVTTRNCCPDAPLTSDVTSTVKPYLSCQNARLQQDRWENNYKQLKFEVVTICPDLITCEVPFPSVLSMKSISRHIMVSDKDTGIIYRNRDCARCHGVTNVVEWIVSAHYCRSVLTDSEGLNMDIFNLSSLFEHCAFFMLPPPGYEEASDGFLCTNPYTHMCNLTGNWAVYDKEVEDRCKSKDYEIYNSMAEDTRNPYCIACNGALGFDSYEYCVMNAHGRTPIPELNIFSLLLPTNHDDPPTGRCEEQEIYDHLQDRCQQLYCQVLYRPFYSTCQRMPIRLNAYMYKIVFKFEPMMKHVGDVQDGIDTIRDAKKRLVSKPLIHLNLRISCVQFGVIYKFRSAAMGYIVFYTSVNMLAFVDGCSFHHKTFDEFNNKHVLVNLSRNGENVIYKAYVVDPDKDEIKADAAYFTEQNEVSRFYHNSIEYHSYEFPLLFIARPNVCPYILLSNIEACRLSAYAKNTYREVLLTDNCTLPDGFILEYLERINIDQYEQSESKKWKICANTYLTMTRPQKENNDDGIPKDNAIIVITVLSLLGLFIILLQIVPRTEENRTIYVSPLFNLMIAQSSSQLDRALSDTTALCAVLGMIYHFSWLATAFSLCAFCVFIYKQIYFMQQRSADNAPLIMFFMFSYIIPLCLVAANIVYSLIVSGYADLGYVRQYDQCDFDSFVVKCITFTLPIVTVGIVNIMSYCKLVWLLQAACEDLKTLILWKTGCSRSYTVGQILLVLSCLGSFCSHLFPSNALGYVVSVTFSSLGVVLFISHLYNIHRLRKSEITSIVVRQSEPDTSSKET